MKLLTNLATPSLLIFIFTIQSNILFSKNNNTTFQVCKRDVIYNIPSKNNLQQASCISESEFLFTIKSNEEDKKLSTYQKPASIGKKPSKIIILED